MRQCRRTNLLCVGAGLARDSLSAVLLTHRVACIAGKPGSYRGGGAG